MKKKYSFVILVALCLMPLVMRAQDSVTITFVVNDSTNGTINPAPGTYTFAEGEEYSVTATAVDGYRLMGWVITVEHNGEMSYIPLDTAVATLTANADVVNGSWAYNVVAIFETADIYLDSLTVVVEVNHPYMGTTTPEPGIYHYGPGETFFIQAEANEGYEFIGWHFTISHPTFGVSQYEDMLMPYNSVGPIAVDYSLLGYVNRLVALFAPLEVEGVEGVDAVDFNAYGTDGRIFLNGAEGREVYLFDIYGRMLHHSSSANITETYTVPSMGVYLIRVEGLGSKLVLVTR
jgi:hypothetical protein